MSDESDNNNYVKSSAALFAESTFKRRFTVKPCGANSFRFRSLSAAEYLEFVAAGGDNATLVMLSVCDDNGIALFGEAGDRERLSGPTFDGLVLQQMAVAAIAHCFEGGIEAKQETAAGNS